MDGLDCVVFDCDGVLVDATSSWRTLHDHFGTDNNANLQRFIAGEFDDLTFMRSDIALWKAVQNPIHQDDLFRCLLYTSPSPRDKRQSRMPSSA